MRRRFRTSFVTRWRRGVSSAGIGAVKSISGAASMGSRVSASALRGIDVDIDREISFREWAVLWRASWRHCFIGQDGVFGRQANTMHNLVPLILASKSLAIAFVTFDVVEGLCSRCNAAAWRRGLYIREVHGPRVFIPMDQS